MAQDVFAQAFEDAPIGMAFMALDGTYLRVNQAHCETLRYSADQLVGMRWQDTIDPADVPAAIAWLAEIVRRREARARMDELRYRRSDGELIWELKTATLILDDAGEPDYFVCQFMDVTARRVYEAELERRALHDLLTGLPNRALFTDRLREALRRQQRTGEALGVVALDLDGFKRVNDSLGHGAGDEVLIQTAQRLESALGLADTVCRLGGDQFAVLRQHLAPESAEAAMLALADRLLACVQEQPYVVAGHEIVMRASAGVAITHAHTDVAAERLLAEADAALHRAKARGGGGLEVAREETIQAAYRLRMESDLRHAMEGSDGLWLAYQPIVDLRGGEVVGLEALLRWERPGHGTVSPGEIIPVAEEAGLIGELGAWVLDRAVTDLGRWGGREGPYVAVNLGAEQFMSETLARDLRECLHRNDVDPGHISLEITEGVAMADAAVALRTMQALKEVGVRLAIDDFGTGFSSLAYLKRFPADTLKIDRVFVADVDAPSEDRAIVAAVLSMADALGMEVVAEGVETERQREALELMGCGWAQGFLFARPGPIEALAR
jgi:diguanylate cyclase (GGDEF)-like protein/PAS domain S-box-containing protein